MFAARRSSSTERETDAPYPGQRTSGWHQTRHYLDSHCVTNHTVSVREGDTTQSRAKSPDAPQTSTLSFFHTPHKIVVKDTDEILERHTTWSSFASCFSTLFPFPRSDLSHRINHHCGEAFSLTCHLEWKWLETKPEVKRASEREDSVFRVLENLEIFLACEIDHWRWPTQQNNGVELQTRERFLDHVSCDKASPSCPSL